MLFDFGLFAFYDFNSIGVIIVPVAGSESLKDFLCSLDGEFPTNLFLVSPIVAAFCPLVRFPAIVVDHSVDVSLFHNSDLTVLSRA